MQKEPFYTNLKKFLFLQKIQHKFRISLWLLPAAMGIIAMLLGFLLLFLEYRYQHRFTANWVPDLSQRSLITTLSMLLAAIVTVFGILIPLIFSILLRASNQFTPKILNIYRSALFPKLFMGLILGSTLYLMTVIAVLNLFFYIVPTLSLLVAFILIIIIIYSVAPFFDRLTMSLEPNYLVRAITCDMKEILKNLETLQTADNQEELNAFQDRSFIDETQYPYMVRAQQAGYLETINVVQLIEICEKKNIGAVVPVRTGDFILTDDPLLYIKGVELSDKECVAELHDQFSFGSHRLAITDLELQLEELLSIIVRALSPGVTDLSTAIECINYLGSICNLMLNKQLSLGIHKDQQGQVRLLTKEIDFSGFVHAAFDPIRQNAVTQPAVILQALNVIKRLIDNCKSLERANILKQIAHQFVEEEKVKRLPFDHQKMEALLQSIEKSVDKIK